MFHVIHDCDSFTKTNCFSATCFSNCSTVSKVLEQTGSEQNIKVHKLQSSLFLEVTDVSIVVILLLLAHLNFLTLWRPVENKAFENGIITPTPTLKYHQNPIKFSWKWTEW